MGALLQRVGLQRTPSQALIQAPSAELIRSDNELAIPEPEEIQLEIGPEELAKYAQVSKKCGFDKHAVDREKLLHLLKLKNLRTYNRLKVNRLMDRYVKHAFKNLQLGYDLWWMWIGLEKYRHPLPPRVADNIKTILFADTDEHSQNNFLFFVSDIILVTNRNGFTNGGSSFRNTEKAVNEWQVIPTKRNTEICFLKVAPSADTLPEESLIIDAWRGPTFSDEEAKI